MKFNKNSYFAVRLIKKKLILEQRYILSSQCYREEVQSNMSPANWPPEPPELQNDLLTNQNHLPISRFWYSQHDQKVFNIGQTMCLKKSSFIKIKISFFVLISQLLDSYMIHLDERGKTTSPAQPHFTYLRQYASPEGFRTSPKSLPGRIFHFQSSKFLLKMGLIWLFKHGSRSILSLTFAWYFFYNKISNNNLIIMILKFLTPPPLFSFSHTQGM